DPEREEKRSETSRLAPLDALHEVARREISHALETRQVRRAQLVEVGGVAEHRARARALQQGARRLRGVRRELLDERVAQSLDVHRRAAREVLERLPQL